MILHTPSNGACKPMQIYEWPDGLFDVAWCESADNICATAGGDGAVQIWNTATQKVATKINIKVYLRCF